MKKLVHPKIGRNNRRPPKHAYYTCRAMTIQGCVVAKLCAFILDKNREVLVLGHITGNHYEHLKESAEYKVRQLFAEHFTKASAAAVAVHQCPVPAY